MTKDDLESMSIPGMLGLHADTMAELNRRGITRSGNGPVADYAEHLVCKTLSPRGGEELYKRIRRHRCQGQTV